MNQATIDTIRAALNHRIVYAYSYCCATDRQTPAQIEADARAALAELEAMRDTRGGWEPVVDGEYDMDDGNVYKLDAGRKLLRYENGYYCGSMQLPRGWRLFQQQIKQEG
jgi:hypothetical protein